MNSKCIYFVEGECEKQLINALKISPEILTPGKVKYIMSNKTLSPNRSYLRFSPKQRLLWYLILMLRTGKL